MLIAADDIAAGRLIEVGGDLASFTPKAMGAYQFVAKADRWDANLIRRFRHWLVSTIAREHPAFKAEEASRD
jgi:hypothetical protein